jgi:Tol biopolymer transport system component/predicted Ser/Thr protein kinase
MLAVGSRVGPYEITGLLGQGGMGRVYRARDIRLGRDVALKFLRDSASARTLLKEARAASALSHPAICHVYDVGDSPEGSWIAMEYVPGTRLDADPRLASGGVPADDVIRLGVQIADALDHAHAHGILHRDLKTANIIARPDGRLAVLDFGLAEPAPAALSEAVTRTGTADGLGLSGTPEYMAPEVLRGARGDERSDLWALGVVLFELATGARPFEGATTFELAASILDKRIPPLPAHVPPPLGRIISKLLEKDPASRYARASEVKAALAAITETAHAVAATPRAGGRRSSLTVIGVILLLGVGIAAWGWFSLRSTSLAVSNVQLASPDDRLSQHAPAFSPDGALVAFVSPDANGVDQVFVRKTEGGTPVQVTFGAAASRPAWHPATGEVAFGVADQGIWMVSALGGTPRRLLDQGRHPSFSSDGARMVFERAGRIWIAAGDGSGAREVTGVPPKYYSIPWMPAISPDGTRIVFFRAEAGPNGDFWIVQADNGEARQLTFDLREGSWPVWTPDGRDLLFSSARAGSRTLWQLRPDGGAPQPLTTGAGEDDEPAISRDGTRLLFTNTRNSSRLCIRDPGKAERQILEWRTAILFPTFSPDGRRVAFFARAGYAVAIFTVGIDGSDLRQLTGGTELNHHPRWSADGEHVVFYQQKPELSLRRVPALGGASTAILPWNWERENAMQYGRDGRTIVYTRLRLPGAPGTDPEVSVVHDVTTGQERELPPPHKHYCHYSPDGRWISGSHHDGSIVVCPAAGGACRTVAKAISSSPNAWSADSTRVYFLRASDQARNHYDLWSASADGSGERPEGALGTFLLPIDVFFDVSADDRTVWASTQQGRRELWTAVLK